MVLEMNVAMLRRPLAAPLLYITIKKEEGYE